MLLGAVLVGLGIGIEATNGGSRLRDLAAMGLAIVIAAAAIRRPRWAMVAVLVYLPIMGLIRRLLIPVAGWTPYDPLVLLAPVTIAVIYLAYMYRRGRERSSLLMREDRLTYLVQLLVVVQILEMFNPLQGGLLAGLTGAIFSLVPLLWMVAAKAYFDETLLRKVLAYVAAFAVVAALYGLHQTFYGLLPFEQDWVALAGYAALYVGNHIRAFSTFSSAAEYAQYLAIGLMVWWGGVLHARPVAKIGALAAMAVLGYALFLESSRGVIILSLAGMLSMLMVQQRSWGRRILLLVVALVLFAGVYHVLGRFAATASTNSLVAHQLGGLANPFNSQYSTLPAHFQMMISGLVSGLKDPFGHGLGSTNLGGALFGGTSASAEVDFSNMFISSGLVGGILYLIVMAMVYIRVWMRAAEGSRLAQVGLGILTCTVMSWLIGGNYSTVALIWTAIGVLAIARPPSQRAILDASRQS
jgi:hypothetical protein